MTLFQWLTLPGIGLLALWEIRGLLDRSQDPRGRWVRLMIWGAAGFGIAVPNLTSAAARAVGIGRGTDLVVYVFMLGTTIVLFRLYAKSFSLQREIVELARREALRSARQGSPGRNGIGDATLIPEGSLDEPGGREHSSAGGGGPT